MLCDKSNKGDTLIMNSLILPSNLCSGLTICCCCCCCYFDICMLIHFTSTLYWRSIEMLFLAKKHKKSQLSCTQKFSAWKFPHGVASLSFCFCGSWWKTLFVRRNFALFFRSFPGKDLSSDNRRGIQPERESLLVDYRIIFIPVHLLSAANMSAVSVISRFLLSDSIEVKVNRN